jgi:hypothetical protein
MTTAKYVPQQVIEQGALVAWTVRMGVVTSEALAEREEVSIGAATMRLDEAVSLGLMTRASVLVGYSSLYTVTRAGRILARRHKDAGGYVYVNGLRTLRVSIRSARHAIACAGVRAALESRYPDCRVVGEVELSIEEREQGRRLATVETQGDGEKRVHHPDLVIWPPATPEPPLPVAVEVELTCKGREELLENCRAWAECRYVEAVIYFAETRTVETKLLDAIEELGAQEMIVVNPLREILNPLPGFPLTDE